MDPNNLSTESSSGAAVYDRIIALLTASNASFETLNHTPTLTSQESANVRGVPLASGAKAMLLKVPKALPHGGVYVLAVLSAARSVNLSKVKSLVNSKRLSLASVEDVLTVAGTLPGAVPPFGSLFSGVVTLVDRSLLTQGDTINFNAGLRTRSVMHLRVADYLALEKPTVCDFSEEPSQMSGPASPSAPASASMLPPVADVE